MKILKHKRTILLDLGGVVFQSTGKSNDAIQWDVISKLNDQYGHTLNIGEDKFGEFMAAYNKQTHQSISGAEFLKLVFDTLDINQALIDLLQDHFNIIIASDNYRENIEYISKRYHFDEWSQGAFYSYDLQMVKADKGFFPLVIAQLGISVDDLLLVDDSPEKIASAERSGIDGILYQNVDQVRVALVEKNWL